MELSICVSIYRSIYLLYVEDFCFAIELAMITLFFHSIQFEWEYLEFLLQTFMRTSPRNIQDQAIWAYFHFHLSTHLCHSTFRTQKFSRLGGNDGRVISLFLSMSWNSEESTDKWVSALCSWDETQGASMRLSWIRTSMARKAEAPLGIGLLGVNVQGRLAPPSNPWDKQCLLQGPVTRSAWGIREMLSFRTFITWEVNGRVIKDNAREESRNRMSDLCDLTK